MMERGERWRDISYTLDRPAINRFMCYIGILDRKAMHLTFQWIYLHIKAKPFVDLFCVVFSHFYIYCYFCGLFFIYVQNVFRTSGLVVLVCISFLMHFYNSHFSFKVTLDLILLSYLMQSCFLTYF